jgi:beta-lactamase class A
MNKQILLTLLLVSGSVLPGCVHSPDPSRKSVAIAVFIAGSKAPLEQRESVMSAVASAVIQAVQ